MSEEQGHSQAHDEQKRVQRTEHTAAPVAPGLEGMFVPSISPSYSDSLLGDPRLNGRGNEPVRVAVMRQMQRTHGNRAVQRFLQRQQHGAPLPKLTPSIRSETNIQRTPEEDEQRRRAGQPAQQRTPGEVITRAEAEARLADFRRLRGQGGNAIGGNVAPTQDWHQYVSDFQEVAGRSAEVPREGFIDSRGRYRLYVAGGRLVPADAPLPPVPRTTAEWNTALHGDEAGRATIPQEAAPQQPRVGEQPAAPQAPPPAPVPRSDGLPPTAVGSQPPPAPASRGNIPPTNPHSSIPPPPARANIPPTRAGTQEIAAPAQPPASGGVEHAVTMPAPAPAPAPAAPSGGIAERIDSVEQALVRRQQHMQQGGVVVQRLTPELMRSEWHRLGGTGEPPPAFIDRSGVMVVDYQSMGPIDDRAYPHRPGIGGRTAVPPPPPSVARPPGTRDANVPPEPHPGGTPQGRAQGAAPAAPVGGPQSVDPMGATITPEQPAAPLPAQGGAPPQAVAPGQILGEADARVRLQEWHTNMRGGHGVGPGNVRPTPDWHQYVSEFQEIAGVSAEVPRHGFVNRQGQYRIYAPGGRLVAPDAPMPAVPRTPAEWHAAAQSPYSNPVNPGGNADPHAATAQQPQSADPNAATGQQTRPPEPAVGAQPRPRPATRRGTPAPQAPHPVPQYAPRAREVAAAILADIQSGRITPPTPPTPTTNPANANNTNTGRTRPSRTVEPARGGPHVEAPAIRLGPSRVERIASAANRGVAGSVRILSYVGMATSAYEIINAPPGDRLRLAGREAAGFAGGSLGTVVGGMVATWTASLLCGPAAPACAILITITFASQGDELARSAYDQAPSAREMVTSLPSLVPGISQVRGGARGDMERDREALNQTTRYREGGPPPAPADSGGGDYEPWTEPMRQVRDALRGSSPAVDDVIGRIERLSQAERGRLIMDGEFNQLLRRVFTGVDLTNINNALAGRSERVSVPNAPVGSAENRPYGG